MERICLIASESLGVINPNIYGHFSEHIGGVFRDGLWVGEDSEIENVHGFRKFIIDRFKALNPPVLRFPGGCFAETYNWRDGIGPRDKRPKTLGWWYRDDGRLETNEVGIHEFTDFCRMTGAEPYIAANITSTTPLEMRNFMDYCNMPAHSTTLSEERANNGNTEPLNIKYWGIGNENWGGGGNMTPEQYARDYVKYSTICETSNVNGAHYIACGANSDDVNWTDRFMREYAGRCGCYAVAFHYYCGRAGDPIGFTEEEWYKLIDKAADMRRHIELHKAAMYIHDQKRQIKLICDEWGCWHQGGSGPSKGYNLFEQQSTIRDAMVAALTLNIFNDNCDSVVMANVAQLCNNIHCLFLTGGSNAIVTPTYWVYDLFKGHQGGRQIKTVNSCDKLSVSASEKDGKLTVTACNLSYNEPLELDLSSFDLELASNAFITTLTGDPHDHNTFEQPDKVKPTEKTALESENGRFIVKLAPASINLIEIGG